MATTTNSQGFSYDRVGSLAVLGHFLIFSACFSVNLRGEEAASPLDSLREFAEEKVSQRAVAGGCILIMHQGSVIFHEGFGFANIQAKTPFTPNESVVLASISKPMLATALFRLAQDGRLDLGTTIDHYLPEFENAKLKDGKPVTRLPTTIELISHTGGAPAFYEKGGKPWLNPWTKDFSLAGMVEYYSKEYRFEFRPGTDYAYSGIGTDIAARVGEVTSGMPRNELLRDELVKPLGLTSTGYRDQDWLPDSMPSKYHFDTKTGKLVERERRRIPEKGHYSSSGGTIISNATDVATWLEMIHQSGIFHGHQYLKPSVIETFLQKSQKGEIIFGGLHIRETDDAGTPILIGHSGSSGTDCWIDFNNDLIGVVLTQSGSKAAKPIAQKVRSASLEWISNR